MLARLPETARAKVQVQRSVKNMATIMRQADIAVTPNGRTVYELAAMGVPTISISQNDRETLHLFARYNKGVRYLGMASPRTPQQIQAALVEILQQPDLRREMREALLQTDLRSGLRRVVDEIQSEYWRWKNAQRDQDWRGNAVP
jgi:UDP-N-acetylglucosamine:LPS N-acetylglucosamine transferase